MTKPLCAICDRTNATSFICSDCKDDPANTDWSTPKEFTVDDIEAVQNAQAGKGVRLSALGRKYRTKRKTTTDLERRIVVAVLRQYVRIDPDMRLINAVEIADTLDCSADYVRKVMKAMRQ